MSTTNNLLNNIYDKLSNNKLLSFKIDDLTNEASKMLDLYSDMAYNNLTNVKNNECNNLDCNKWCHDQWCYFCTSIFENPVKCPTREFTHRCSTSCRHKYIYENEEKTRYRNWK